MRCGVPHLQTNGKHTHINSIKKQQQQQYQHQKKIIINIKTATTATTSEKNGDLYVSHAEILIKRFFRSAACVYLTNQKQHCLYN